MADDGAAEKHPEHKRVTEKAALSRETDHLALHSI
jgi:hypothetical protein